MSKTEAVILGATLGVTVVMTVIILPVLITGKPFIVAKLGGKVTLDTLKAAGDMLSR